MEPEKQKKSIRDSKYFPPAAFALGVLCIAIAFYYLIHNFSNVAGVLAKIYSVITPFIVGGVIAYLVNPILRFLEKVTKNLLTSQKLRRVVCLFASYAVVFFVLWTLLGVVLPKIAESIEELVKISAPYINNVAKDIIEWIRTSNLNDYLNTEQINQLTAQINTAISGVFDLAKQIIPALFSLTSSLTKVFINFFVGLMVSIYILLGKEKLGAQCKKALYAWWPKRSASRFLDFLRLTDDIFSNFVIGEILDSLIVGVLCFVTMSIFQIPYALLVSVLVGVTNVIPYFGPFFGAIPSVLMLLPLSPQYALGFALLILIIQQLDGNIIKPLVLGDSMGLSGIWILLAVTVGGGLWKIPGMILGVPLCAVGYAVFVTASNKRLRAKQMPPQLSAYALAPHKEKPKKHVKILEKPKKENDK